MDGTFMKQRSCKAISCTYGANYIRSNIWIQGTSAKMYIFHSLWDKSQSINHYIRCPSQNNQLYHKTRRACSSLKKTIHSPVLNLLHDDIIEISTSSMEWKTAKGLHLIFSWNDLKVLEMCCWKLLVVFPFNLSVFLE